MKKNLQNAMTSHFQNMVGVQQNNDDQVEEKPVNAEPAKPATKQAEAQSPVMNEPVSVPEPTPVAAPNPAPVQPVAPQPVYEQPVAVQPAPQAPVEPVFPTPTPQIVTEVAANTQPVNNIVQTSETYVEESVSPVRHSKKSIPLMPDEKSSGVLHIRLGELRSYVDFMTQSGKISYQQYISNLIEQDYEKNKDLYLKYKSFMEQLNL